MYRYNDLGMAWMTILTNVAGDRHSFRDRLSSRENSIEQIEQQAQSVRCHALFCKIISQCFRVTNKFTVDEDLWYGLFASHGSQGA